MRPKGERVIQVLLKDGFHTRNLKYTKACYLQTQQRSGICFCSGTVHPLWGFGGFGGSEHVSSQGTQELSLPILQTMLDWEHVTLVRANHRALIS